jgi:uncharacterized protein YdeI (YjbR/CyaY-like superfamily)
MSPLDVSRAIEMPSAEAFDRWLQACGASDKDAIVAIFKKSSGKQSVTFDELLETALCHGWVDTQTNSIDSDRYAIRFMPRRAGSNWSAGNRRVACCLVVAGRFSAAGKAVLPADF